MGDNNCNSGSLVVTQVNQAGCTCVGIQSIQWNLAGTQFTITLTNGQTFQSPVLTGPASTVYFRVQGTVLQYSLNNVTWTSIFDFTTSIAWNAVGSGGNMPNGQAVPAFAAGITNVGSGTEPLRLRQNLIGEIELEGLVSLSLSNSGQNEAYTIVTTPTGYRPAYTTQGVAYVTDLTGNPYSARWSITTGGVVSLIVDDNITAPLTVHAIIKINFDVQ